MVLLVTLLLTALLVLQIPAAQTALARKVLHSIEKSIDGRIEFSDMTFVPFNGLVIKNIAIIDDNPLQGDPRVDTLFNAETVAARFTLQGPALVLEDLGSTNGTLVNGHPIGQPVTLRDGDEVQVGDAIMRVSRR